MSRVTRAAVKALSVSPTEGAESPKLRTRRGTTPDVQKTPSKYTPATRTRRAESSVDYVPSPLRRSRRLSTNSEEVSTPTKPRNIRSVPTLAEQPVPEERELVQTPKRRGRPRRETESTKNQDVDITPEKKRKAVQASKKEDDHTDKKDGNTETAARVTTRRGSSRLTNSQTPTKGAKRTVVKLKRCSSHSECSDLEHEKQQPMSEPVSTEKKKYLLENETKKAQEKTPVKSAEDAKSAKNGENEKHKQKRSDVDAKNLPQKSPFSSSAVKSHHATEANSDMSRVTTEKLGKKDNQKNEAKEDQTDVKNTSKARVRESLSGIEGASSNSNPSIKRERIIYESGTIEISDSEDSSQSSNENEMESFIIADSEMDQSGRDSSGSESEEETRKNEIETSPTSKEEGLKSSKTQDMSISDDGNEPVTSPFPPVRRIPALVVNSAEDGSEKEQSFCRGDISNAENSMMSISSEDVIPETQQIVNMDVDIENEANAETRLGNSSICIESTNEQKDYGMKSNRESVSRSSPSRSAQLNQSSVGMDISQKANEDNSESNKSVEDAVNPETLLNTTSTSQLTVANQEAMECENETDLNERTNVQTESLRDRRSLTEQEDSNIGFGDVNKKEELQLDDKVSVIGESNPSCDDDVSAEKHDTEICEKHNQSIERNAGDISMASVGDVQSEVVECTNMKSTTVVENEKAKTSDRYSISSTLNVSSNKSMPAEEESNAITTDLSNRDTSSHNINDCQQHKSPSNAQVEIPLGDNFVDRIEAESQDLEASSMLPLNTSNKSLPQLECHESSGKRKSFKNSEQNTERSVSKKNDASMKQHLELNKNQSVGSCNTTMTASSPSSTSCITNVSSSKKRSRISLQSDWNKLNDSEEEDDYDQLVNSGRESALHLQLANANISGNTSGSELNLDKNAELSTSVSSVRSRRDRVSCDRKSEQEETKNYSMLLKNECADSPYHLRVIDSTSRSEHCDEDSDASEVQENKSFTRTPNKKLNVQKRSSIINSNSKRINTSSKNNVSGLLDVSKSHRENPIESSDGESSSDTEEFSNDVSKARCVVECISEVIETKLKEPKESSTGMVVDEVVSTVGADTDIEAETVESRRSLTNIVASKSNAESDSGNDSDDVGEVKNKGTSGETSSLGQSYEKQDNATVLSFSKSSEKTPRKSFGNQWLVETVKLMPQEASEESESSSESDDSEQGDIETTLNALAKSKYRQSSEGKPRESISKLNVSAAKPVASHVGEVENKVTSGETSSVGSKLGSGSDVNEEQTQNTQPAENRLSKLPAQSPRKPDQKEANATDLSFSRSSKKSPRQSYEKQDNATVLSFSKSSEKTPRKSFDNQWLLETVKLMPQEASEESESSSESDDLEQGDIETTLNVLAKNKYRQSSDGKPRESISKLNVPAAKPLASHVGEMKNKVTSAETSSVGSKLGSGSDVNDEPAQNTQPAENRLSKLPAQSPTKPDQKESNETDLSFSRSSKKSPLKMLERQVNLAESSFSKSSQKSPRKSYEKQDNATVLKSVKSSEKTARKSIDNQWLVETVKLIPQDASEESESSSESDDSEQGDIETTLNALAKSKYRQSSEGKPRESISKVNVSAAKPVASHVGEVKNKVTSETSSVGSKLGSGSDMNEEQTENAQPAENRLSKLPAQSSRKPDQKEANATDLSFSRSSKKSPRQSYEKQDNATVRSFSKSSEKTPRKSFDNQWLVETVKLMPQEASEESESSSESDDSEQGDIETTLNALAKNKYRQSSEGKPRESISKLNVSAAKPVASHESNKSSIEGGQTSKSDENKLNKSSNNSLQLKSSKVQNISLGHNSPVTANISNSNKCTKEILQAKASSGESSTDSDESSIDNEENSPENEENSPAIVENSPENDESSTDSDASNSDSSFAETDLNKSGVKRLSVNGSKRSSFVSKTARQSVENIKQKSFQQPSSDESDTDTERAQVIRKKSSTKTSLVSESKFSPNCKQPLTLEVDRKGSSSSNESSSDTEEDDGIDEQKISRNLTNRSTPYVSKTRNESAGDNNAKSLQIGSNSDDDSMEESETSEEEEDSHPKISRNDSQKLLALPANRNRDNVDQPNNETSSNESESESSDESDESTNKESITKSSSKVSTTTAAPLSQQLSSQKVNTKAIQSNLSCQTVSKMSTESGYVEMDDQKNKNESLTNKLKRKESLERRVSVQKDFGKVSLMLNDSKTAIPKKPAVYRRESLLNRLTPQPIVSQEPKALVERQQLSFSQKVKRQEQSGETDSIDSSSEGDAMKAEANRANRSQASNASKMQRKSISFHDSLKVVGSKAAEKETEEDSSESDSSSDENLKRISGKTEKHNLKNLSKSSCILSKSSRLLVEDRTSDETSGSTKQPIEKTKTKSKLDRSKSLNVSLKRPLAPTTSQANKQKQTLSLKHTAVLKASQNSNTTQQLSETSSMHQESAGDTSNTNISTKSEMPFFKSLKKKNQSTPASNHDKVKIKINDHTYISSDEKTEDLGQNSKVVSHPGASKAQTTRPEDASRAGKVSIVEQLLKEAARNLLNKSKGAKRKRANVQSSSDNSFENYAPMSEKERIVLKKLKQKRLAQKDKKRPLFESEVLKEILMDKINEAIKAGKIADAKKKKETVPNKPDSMVDRLKNAVTAFKAKETPETETEVLRAFFAFNRANKKPTSQNMNKAVAPGEQVLSAFAAYNLTGKKIDKDKPSTSGTMPTKKRKQEDVLEEESVSASASTSQKPHKKPQSNDIEPKSKKLKHKEHEGQVKKQIETKPKKSHVKESNKTISSVSTVTSSSSQNETVTSIASTSSIGSGSEWQVRAAKPKKVLKVLNEIPFGFKESPVTPKKVNGFAVSNATPKTIGWKVRSITDAGMNVPDISKKERKLKRKRKCEDGESSPTRVWTSSGYFQVSDVINPVKQRKYQLDAPGASTEFLVQPLNRDKLKSSGSSEYFSLSALEFKQKAHSNKQIKRESSKEMLQRKVKAKYY